MTDKVKETIQVDGVDHVVEAAPLTLICHAGNMNIRKDDAVVISPEETVLFCKELTRGNFNALTGNPLFVKCWSLVFSKYPDGEHYIGIPVYENRDQLLPAAHMIGLLGLIFECVALQRKIFLKFPETYLHPANQANLADMFVFLFTGEEAHGNPK